MSDKTKQLADGFLLTGMQGLIVERLTASGVLEQLNQVFN